jgi:hypothetical protein
MDIDPDLQSALDTDDQPTPPPLRYIEEDSSPGSSHFGHGRTVTDGSEADDRMLSLEEIVAHRTALATGLENPEELRRIVSIIPKSLHVLIRHTNRTLALRAPVWPIMPLSSMNFAGRKRRLLKTR